MSVTSCLHDFDDVLLLDVLLSRLRRGAQEKAFLVPCLTSCLSQMFFSAGYEEALESELFQYYFLLRTLGEYDVEGKIRAVLALVKTDFNDLHRYLCACVCVCVREGEERRCCGRSVVRARMV